MHNCERLLDVRTYPAHWVDNTFVVPFHVGMGLKWYLISPEGRKALLKMRIPNRSFERCVWRRIFDTFQGPVCNVRRDVRVRGPELGGCLVWEKTERVPISYEDLCGVHEHAGETSSFGIKIVSRPGCTTAARRRRRRMLTVSP